MQSIYHLIMMDVLDSGLAVQQYRHNYSKYTLPMLVVGQTSIKVTLKGTGSHFTLLLTICRKRVRM